MKKILMLLLSLFCCSYLYAEPFKQIIFFGDSLTDDGNLHRLFKVVPNSPYYIGRFSNGPTWAEDFGRYYYDKHFTDFKNYAYGGATAYLHAPNGTTSSITLTEELVDYYLQSIGADRSNTLFVIWIGANDYLYENKTDVATLTNTVVAKITWAITSLINHGAKNFMILNLPDLSSSPYARFYHSIDRLHQISDTHYQKINAMVSDLQKKYSTMTFVEIDVYHIFADMLLNPTKYDPNISDITHACYVADTQISSQDITNLNIQLHAMSQFILNTPSLLLAYKSGKSTALPCDNPNQHVFWDALHPTAAVHLALATQIEDQLTKAGLG